MYRKILTTLFFFIAITNAVEHHQHHHQEATSFVSFNNNHNSINHVPSAAAAGGIVQTQQFEKSYYSAPKHDAVSKIASVSAPETYSYYVPSSSAQKIVKYDAPHHYSSSSFSATAPSSASIISYNNNKPSLSSYKEEEEDVHVAPIPYEFAYSVADHHTGDIHSQEEHHDGHHVVGQYSLHEADGTVRIVKYSDDGHGFNAIVEKQGHPTTEAPHPHSADYKKIIPVTPQHYHHY